MSYVSAMILNPILSSYLGYGMFLEMVECIETGPVHKNIKNRAHGKHCIHTKKSVLKLTSNLSCFNIMEMQIHSLREGSHNSVNLELLCSRFFRK